MQRAKSVHGLEAFEMRELNFRELLQVGIVDTQAEGFQGICVSDLCVRSVDV